MSVNSTVHMQTGNGLATIVLNRPETSYAADAGLRAALIETKPEVNDAPDKVIRRRLRQVLE